MYQAPPANDTTGQERSPIAVVGIERPRDVTMLDRLVMGAIVAVLAAVSAWAVVSLRDTPAVPATGDGHRCVLDPTATGGPTC